MIAIGIISAAGVLGIQSSLYVLCTKEMVAVIAEVTLYNSKIGKMS